DLREDTLLRGGGLKWQHLLQGLADVRTGDEGGAGALAHLAALEGEAELEVEELFEDEAAVGGRGGGHQLGHGRAGLREMGRAECRRPPGKAEAGEHRRGK